MSDLVIFGAGDIAELAQYYFERDSVHRPVAFVVDAGFVKEASFKGLPVLAIEEVASRFPPDRHAAFVALSYNRLNALRAERCAAMEALGYGLASYVSTRATMLADQPPGPNAFILENNVVQPFVRIGRNVTLWSGNHIGHHSVIEDDVFIASHVVVSGGVRIGQASFVGVNATIRDHVSLGARCVIGAGALVLEDQAEQGVLPAQATGRSPVPSSRLRRI